MTNPTAFEQLLQAASQQAEPQRLLFLFASAELPPEATAAQRLAFEAGHGGTLEPLACVDKGLDELTTFAELASESRNACAPWQVVFVAALSGADGRPPSSALVDGALDAMMERVRGGKLHSLLALDPQGQQLVLT